MLAAILGILFLGVAALAGAIRAVPTEEETVISQVSEAVFGRSPAYYVVQLSTTIILILAANTGFNGFPVLAAALARDGFMPRQLANRGDRLGYSNGIILLGIVAGALVVGFGGDTHALIPLFAVGVFISFTLSQAGMAVHWWHLRSSGWIRPAAINAVGAVVTFVATVVILEAKFVEGAWIVALLLPIFVWAFLRIRAHYDESARELTVDPGAAAASPPDPPHGGRTDRTGGPDRGRDAGVRAQPQRSRHGDSRHRRSSRRRAATPPVASLGHRAFNW